ncbi:hypothetical protein AJ80_03981 [Polytolypa hystricis UAMH7299]|uniref:Uncharacterized protein n=1 Tax=Polytolypa hystricis (strain UAMH7299) TaxID=1447883 RepID=A0A2B7YE64_POLH7|nr:hypothetical protein AJ80_03981 [Polytolypa hystricis UAMH7299]
MVSMHAHSELTTPRGPDSPVENPLKAKPVMVSHGYSGLASLHRDPWSEAETRRLLAIREDNLSKTWEEIQEQYFPGRTADYHGNAHPLSAAICSRKKAAVLTIFQKEEIPLASSGRKRRMRCSNKTVWDMSTGDESDSNSESDIPFKANDEECTGTGSERFKKPRTRAPTLNTLSARSADEPSRASIDGSAQALARYNRKLQGFESDFWLHILQNARECEAEREKVANLIEDRTEMENILAEKDTTIADLKQQLSQRRPTPQTSTASIVDIKLELEEANDKARGIYQKYMAPAHWESEEVQEALGSVVRKADKLVKLFDIPQMTPVSGYP